MHKHNGNIAKWITVKCPNCGSNKRIINGQWLKMIRVQADLDQRAFGRYVNVTSPYISDIERNRRDCPTDILEMYLSFRGTNE